MLSKISAGAVLTGVALLLSSAAGAVGRYTDPARDGGEAPDITNVSVTSDASGQIELRVDVVDLPSPADIRTFLVLDTDLNEETGAPDTLGADYLFVVDELDDTYSFGRWTGSDWDWETPYATVRVDSNRTSVAFSVNRSELGNTEAFNFWVRTRKGEVAADQADTAPEDGAWNYSLAAGGPDIRGVVVATNSGVSPRAGKVFTVKPMGLRVGTDSGLLAPQPEAYSCTAKLAGRALVGTGTGRCTWKLSKTARGKRLVVSLTVSYQGAVKTFPFSYRVR